MDYCGIERQGQSTNHGDRNTTSRGTADEYDSPWFDKHWSAQARSTNDSQQCHVDEPKQGG